MSESTIFLVSEISTIGKSVKYYRRKKRWTGGQLATYSGLTSSYVSMLESGKRSGNVRQSTLEKLADALGVTISDLTNFKDPRELKDNPAEYNPNARRDRIHQRINELHDGQLSVLEVFVEWLSDLDKPIIIGE